MLLIPDEGFPALLRQCEREALHLEVLDSYAEPDEHEPFRRFLADEPDDHAWFAPWTELVRETVDRGVVMTRLRIVTEPHTDYTRFALAIAELNAEAGERIRYLPRHSVGEVPPDDFWLFDDETVIFSAFGASGGWSGAVTTDPHIVAYCGSLRDRLWPLAIPFPEYARR